MSDNNVQVIIQEEDPFTATSSIFNDLSVASISDIRDVDTSSEGLLDGSLLVYKTSTNKWTATKLLNKQFIEAGEF